MRTRRLAISLIAGALLAPVVAARPGEDGAAIPRTPAGRPDLEGVWNFATLTPLQRPKNLADRPFLTEEEAAAIEARATARAERNAEPRDPARGPLPVGGRIGSYNSFWTDEASRIEEDRRTSLIVDPPDGRIPPLVPDAKRQTTGEDLPSDYPVRTRAAGIGTDGPENRGLSERCLQGFNTGPPITPRAYNQNIQIFQTVDHVVVLNEMIHDARIVPLDGRPHAPADVRFWLGDSRGRWEGDTLVVDTTNLTDKISSFSADAYTAFGNGATLHLVERFTRVDAETLRYEFTVDDPATFTRPFTAVLLMKRADYKIYEYACHEANYGLRNLLSGARAVERQAAEASREP